MSKMRGYRKNTLVIDFTVLPAKPSATEVQKFVFECLKLDIMKIKNIQMIMQKSYVYIELVPELPAEEVVDKHNRKFCMTNADGLQKQIPLFVADGSIEVKIFDLPPYLPDASIARTLAEYGDVISIKEDTWHDFFEGIPSGTRVVRMELKKPIPSYITIEEMTAFVRYRNQVATCKHCSRHLHLGKKCSEIKKALDAGQSGLTLAEIVRGKNAENDAEAPAGAAVRSTSPHPPILTPVPVDIIDSDSGDAPNKPFENFEISGEESEDAEFVENTEDQDLPPKEERVQGTTSGINDQKQDHKHQREEWKTVSGKRPASPKAGQGKRPSRSTSRK